MAEPRATLVGLISDTHGSLDPRVGEVFAGVELIVHAGDVGSSGLLLDLEGIAPVVAVRGNTDDGAWAYGLPLSATFCVGDVAGVVFHGDHRIALPDRARVVVTGHTHRPVVDSRNGVLHVNPGSASHSRAPGIGTTVALLDIVAGAPRARIVQL